MNKIEIPEFAGYEDEAVFWDNLDTASSMEDDGEWFQFKTVPGRAMRVAILPDLAKELMQLARDQEISVETLVNVFLVERIRQPSDMYSSKA